MLAGRAFVGAGAAQFDVRRHRHRVLAVIAVNAGRDARWRHRKAGNHVGTLIVQARCKDAAVVGKTS